MAFDLDRVLENTEEFLRRNIRSREAREAQKRQTRRKMEEMGRRARRAGFILVALVAVLLALNIFIVHVGFLSWLIALPTIFLFALLTLSWPTRRSTIIGGDFSPSVDLPTLADRAEARLVDRTRILPGRALPAADRISARLAELQPRLGALAPDDPLAGDARRLIGQHLPNLVDAYLELPESSRAPSSDSAKRLAESLGIVADALDELRDQCSRDRQLGFETQSRFIESRYGTEDDLSPKA